MHNINETNMLNTEFQVIIMAAGSGSRMPEITAGRPKCLIPIGNKPLLWYPLQMCERSNFSDVIVVTLENQKIDIQKTIDKLELKIKVEIVSIPTAEDWGTADSLRFIHDKIVSDFVVISCDFITDFDLEDILNTFRKHNASIVNLLFNMEKQIIVPVPGPKSKNKPERDIICIDNKTDRMVFLASASDFDDTLQLSRRLLKKHPDVTMYSRLLDSHLYVMKHWVLEYIMHEKSFSTLKGEVLPHIIKKQLSKCPKLPEQDKNHSLINVETKNDIFQFAKANEYDDKVKALSSYNDHIGDMKSVYHEDSIKCYAIKANSSKFGIRVNTLQAYCAANNQIIERWNAVTGGIPIARLHPKAEIKTKQIDDESLVAEGSKLSEKTSIKKSFISTNCTIENKVRITNCILMNGVKINERCVLQNCVICDDAVIESGVELKDCLIGVSHVVPEESKYSNEVLTAEDKLMEI